MFLWPSCNRQYRPPSVRVQRHAQDIASASIRSRPGIRFSRQRVAGMCCKLRSWNRSIGMVAASLSLDILREELHHKTKQIYTDRRWPPYITNIEAKIVNPGTVHLISSSIRANSGVMQWQGCLDLSLPGSGNDKTRFANIHGQADRPERILSCVNSN